MEEEKSKENTAEVSKKHSGATSGTCDFGESFNQHQIPEIPQDAMGQAMGHQQDAGSNIANQMPMYSTQIPYYPYYCPHISRPPYDQSALFASYSEEYRRREKRRRSRTVFSTEQLTILEEGFSKQHFPDNRVRQEIAVKAGLQEDRVQVWFQNRRAKEKRKLLERRIADEAGNGETPKGETRGFEGENVETMNAIRSLVKSNDNVARAMSENPEEEIMAVGHRKHGIAQDERKDVHENSPTILLIETKPVASRDNHTGVTDQKAYHSPLTRVEHAGLLVTHLKPGPRASEPAVTQTSGSVDNLPKYIFGNYSDGQESTGLDLGGNGVQCEQVTDPEGLELAGTRELVVMDTGRFFAINDELLSEDVRDCTAEVQACGLAGEVVIDEMERSTC